MAASAASYTDQKPTQRSPLFLAFELGANTWSLGFTTGTAQRLRERRMLAGAAQVLLEKMARATEAAGGADTMIEAFRGVPGPLVSLCSEARGGAAFLSYFGATRIQNTLP